MPNCYRCQKEITFDDYHVSPHTGKKIPLDVDTHEAHQCEAGQAVRGDRNDFEYAKLVQRVKDLEESNKQLLIRVASLESRVGEGTPLARLMALERKFAEMELKT